MKIYRSIACPTVVGEFALLCALCATSATEIAQAQNVATVASSPDGTAATSSANLLRSQGFTLLRGSSVDTEALRLLASQMSASGTQWKALRVQGNVTMPEVAGTVPAHLLLQGLDQAILSIDQSSGLQAIVIEGLSRKYVFANARTEFDPNLDGVAGLFPLALLHDPSISSQLLALQQGAPTKIGDVLCDKLSLRFASVPGQNSINVSVDFYLDPASHLVLKSVTAMEVPGSPNPQLQETYYSDYKTLSNVMFPQRIRQTIGGHLIWDLAVTDVTVEANIAGTEFER